MKGSQFRRKAPKLGLLPLRRHRISGAQGISGRTAAQKYQILQIPYITRVLSSAISLFCIKSREHKIASADRECQGLIIFRLKVPGFIIGICLGLRMRLLLFSFFALSN